ncbi:peptidase associated/transthyretin-like domain-containing protein [Sediminibacterium soli]|uniref:carboxypeptidase-like regulatory domain-containing protein n=1 Tax=Sediminibacterium soli TaxID=2698829 RepID=UPI00137A4418|nr:carboxypeptidase-like regulatory domain-containing protein [Sediminibacterium soli]NCI45124.1 carboxypeptidase-like regulatory domain-containing protein [Sediminibacterium soli]
MRKGLLSAFIVICLLTGAAIKLQAQTVIVSGTVYDITAKRPLEAVAVLSTSGRGTITDSLGRYSIMVPRKDSLWFSLIGKATMKYPVDTIENMDNFNVMIHVYATQLPEVRVRNNYYKLDSIENRRDYAKYFNFKKPTLRLSNNPNYNPGGLTAAFDLDEIINMFRTRRNRNMAFLQKRLIDEEQNKYVDRRFSKPFVRKITKLESPELEVFMTKYRPSYEMVLLLNDLEFGYYIQKCYEQYLSEKNKWQGGLRR